jgi:hypothetical protein
MHENIGIACIADECSGVLPVLLLLLLLLPGFVFDKSSKFPFFFRHHFRRPMSKNGRGSRNFDMLSTWLQVES